MKKGFLIIAIIVLGIFYYLASDITGSDTSISLATDSASGLKVSDEAGSVTFAGEEFNTVGDTQTLNYELKNSSGTIISVNQVECTFTDENGRDVTSKLSEYIKVSLSNPGSSLEGNGDSLSGNITLEMIKPYVGEEMSYNVSCAITVESV